MADHKTCGGIIVVPAADGTDPESDSQELAQQTLHCVVLALVAYIVGATAWRARREPWDLAFVFGAYAALAGLLLCLRRAEQLTPDSPAAERSRLHAAVWTLSTALSCAFAYRVSLHKPAALVIVVWCMTSFVVLVGFYMLVLCKGHEQYQSVDIVDCGAAGDRKPLIKKSRPGDDMV